MAALTGTTVIDRTTTLSGAICTLLLADAGATVYRVQERRDAAADDDNATVDFVLHRNKQVVAIDITSDKGLQQLLAAAARADVLVEDDGGCPHTQVTSVDYEDLRGSNPGLVYCKLQTWWPDSDLPRWLSELEIQGISGQMSFMGKINETPVRSGADIAAMAGAVHAMIGITGALYSREIAGKGQRVDISVLTAALAIASHWIADFSDPDEFSGGNTTPYSGSDSGYRCRDGRVMFGFFGRRDERKDPWQQLCIALGLESLLENEFLREHGAGIIGGGRDALLWRPLIEQKTERLSTEELMEIIGEIGGAGAPILHYSDLFGEALHPQIEATGSIVSVENQGRAVVAPWVYDLGDVEAIARGTIPVQDGATSIFRDDGAEEEPS